MAIEQFVKHVERLNHHHGRTTRGSSEDSMAHLSADLVKLKDMLKQVMATRKPNTNSNQNS